MLTPPTDSLYKFFAIAGLVMVIWGVAFPWNKAYETRLEVSHLRAEIKAVGKRAEQLQGQYDELTKELQRLETSPTDESMKHALRIEKRDLFIKLIDTQHPIDVDLAKINVVEKANRTYERLGWISVVLGIILTLTGFFAWYYKIQQHLDRDLKKGSERE